MWVEKEIYVSGVGDHFRDAPPLSFTALNIPQVGNTKPFLT